MNLKQHLGNLYRITKDPAANKLDRDKNYQIIEGKYATIYYHGPDDLIGVDYDDCTSTLKQNRIRSYLQSRGGKQHTWTLTLVSIDLIKESEVAKLLKLPRKRKPMSESQKQKLMEASKRSRFKRETAGVKRRPSDLKTDRKDSGDPRVA